MHVAMYSNTGLLASDRMIASLSELAGLCGGPDITVPILAPGNVGPVRDPEINAFPVSDPEMTVCEGAVPQYLS